MEKIGEDWEEEKLKSHTAIRCAKAALLLSSLTNTTKSSTTDLPHLQDGEKLEMLKMKLVKEKQKHTNLKHGIGVLLLSYFLVELIYRLFLIYTIDY